MWGFVRLILALRANDNYVTVIRQLFYKLATMGQ